MQDRKHVSNTSLFGQHLTLGLGCCHEILNHEVNFSSFPQKLAPSEYYLPYSIYPTPLYLHVLYTVSQAVA